MLGTEVITLKLAIYHMVVLVKETDNFNMNFVKKKCLNWFSRKWRKQDD